MGTAESLGNSCCNLMTWSASLNAFTTSPDDFVDLYPMLSLRYSCTLGESGLAALSMSTTAGRDSYSTWTSSDASSAEYTSSATTTATASPAKLTSSTARVALSAGFVAPAATSCAVS